MDRHVKLGRDTRTDTKQWDVRDIYIKEKETVFGEQTLLYLPHNVFP